MSNSPLYPHPLLMSECITFMFLLLCATQMREKFITRFIEKDMRVLCTSQFKSQFRSQQKSPYRNFSPVPQCLNGVQYVNRQSSVRHHVLGHPPGTKIFVFRIHKKQNTWSYFTIREVWMRNVKSRVPRWLSR